MNPLVEWPRAQYWDKCWNPWIGCWPCSPACDNCYAATLARRFKMSFKPHETKQKPPRSGVVFCGNMTDIFGEWMGVMDAAEIVKRTLGNSHKAKYIWLTKRPKQMVAALHDGILTYFAYFAEDFDLSNQYFGFTAENQEWYDRRLADFSAMPKWANSWLSAEPLLGPLDISGHPPFEWVVVGCESGPWRRPCKVEWVEGIVAQAQARGIPVFVKQLDIGGKCVTDITKFPKHLQIRQVPWTEGN